MVSGTAAIDGSKVTAASTSAAGTVQLNDSTNSTSTSEAATANALKTAYDLANQAQTTANAAFQTTGGTITNNVLVSNAKRDAWIKNTDQKLENLDDDKFLSSDLKKQLKSRVELGLEEYQREYASKSIYQEFLDNELKTGELRKRLDVALQRFESEAYDDNGG